MLVLIGVAAAFRTAFLPHTTEPSVASKLAQTNHPVAAVPPQWLPVLLAANTPGPPTSQRRLLDNTFASKAELETAVGRDQARTSPLFAPALMCNVRFAPNPDPNPNLNPSLGCGRLVLAASPKPTKSVKLVFRGQTW